MALPVGVSAPPFALPLVPGEAPLRLSDYVGERPVLLLFFPLAFSSNCTRELRSVQRELGSVEALGAQVIAVSVDSPFVTRRFSEETGATFPVLSDFNREVAGAYDVLDEDYFGLRGVARRSAFVIDRRGRIAHVWESPDDEPPDLEALCAALRDAVRDAG